MEYEKFLNNYSKELQILDAIDLLQHLDPSALDSLNQLGVGSKDDKTLPLTTAVRAGEDAAFWGQSLLPPIAQTSTYRFESAQQLLDHKTGKHPHPEYGRYANPTLSVVEAKLAALEGAGSAVETGQ